MVNLHCHQLTAPLRSSPPWLHHSKDDIRRYPELWQHAGATRKAMEGPQPQKRKEVEAIAFGHVDWLMASLKIANRGFLKKGVRFL